MSQHVSTETIKAACKFAADYYRLHKPYHVGRHPSFLGTEALREAGKKFKVGFGVEGFCWNCGEDGVSYLNMGDTYDYTILFYSESERFKTGTWGDVVESLERRGIVLD